MEAEERSNMTTLAKIIEGLATPTPKHGVGFIPRSFSESTRNPGTYGALAVPYVENAWVRELLDRTCGPFGWQTDTKEVAGLICVGLGIFNPDTGEWIWKWDTGQDNPFQAGKTEPMSSSGRGVFTTSFKRAAYQWGIANDILRRKPIWTTCTAYKSKKDNKMKFKDWSRDPLQSNGPQTRRQPPPRPAGTATVERKADQQTGEVLLSPQAETEGKIEKMRDKCFGYAKSLLDMNDEEIAKFLQPYLDEHGENALAYQIAWNGLVDYRRGKHPSQE